MSIETCFKEISDRLGERARRDHAIAPYVTYQIGGPADILVFPSDSVELQWISKTAKTHEIPITIIGKGTNLLVSDRGIRGITISLLHAFQDIEIESRDADRVLVRCGAGVEKPELLKWAVREGLTGLEFSSGVPGTIGGGIFMNAGTKYGCYGDILKKIQLYDFNQGVIDLKREEVHFGYREQNAVKGTLVLQTWFELRLGDTNSIAKEVERIIAERADKQPLDYPSCGSTFKNPEGFSAGRLIEKAGLKGLIRGGAQISEKHANFILNKGNATARDILSLIDIVKNTVKQQFQVELECEVIFLGEKDEHLAKVSHAP